MGKSCGQLHWKDCKVALNWIIWIHRIKQITVGWKGARRKDRERQGQRGRAGERERDRQEERETSKRKAKGGARKVEGEINERVRGPEGSDFNQVASQQILAFCGVAVSS